MKEWFLTELRECNRVIRKIDDKPELEAGIDRIIHIIHVMCDLSNIARKEGLLSLEEAAGDFGTLPLGDQLKKMILLVVDGTDPELIRDITSMKYFAADFKGFDSLQYLIMQTAVISMQAGENPRIIEEKLISMLPERIEMSYKAREEEKRKNAEEEQKEQMPESHQLSEKLFKGGIAVGPEDTAYYPVKVTDYAIRSLSDRDLQRLLRDVDNNDLELAMMVLSGEARKHFFANLSYRLAVMIAEDMEFMGDVRLEETVQAVVKIFNTLLRLVDYGEIRTTDTDALKLFGRIFAGSSEEDSSRAQERKEANVEIVNLLREYKAHTHKVVKAPWIDKE